MKIYSKYTLVFTLTFLMIVPAFAQLTFNNSVTAQQLAQALAGSGIIVTNATYTCPTNGIGKFGGGLTTNIGLDSGIILTTGANSIASGPNNLPAAGDCAYGSFPGDPTSGDPDLTPLSGTTETYDACKLEFDMTPLCDTLKFNYVFGSEEYPDFVCSQYNDVFAFFISGPGIIGQQNMALIPGTTTPVAINSVNSGSAGSQSNGGSCTSLGYSQYYVDNTGGTTIQYNGFTTVLTAKSAVQACQNYHLKIAIADAGDCAYDSGILLQANSLQCSPTKSITVVQNAVEGCQNGTFKFCRDDSIAALTFNYTIAGTATNGTDYPTLTTSVNIPAGQGCFTLPIVTTVDNINEGTETIKLIYQAGACPLYDTATLSISDPPSLNLHDTTLCNGQTATIGIPSVNGVTYSWTPATGLSSTSISNPVVTISNTGSSPITNSFILTASAAGCVLTDTAHVTINPIPTANAGPDQTICASTATLAGVVGNGSTTGIWTGGTGSYSPNNSNLGAVYTPSATEVDNGSFTLTLTSNDPAGPCPAAIDQVTISISPQAIVSAGPDHAVCIGNSVILVGTIGGTATTGTWNGGAGTFTPNNTSTNVIYTPSASENSAGSVVLTYTANNPGSSCSPVVDSVLITINHLPTANAGSSQHVCAGADISLSGAIGGAATSGTWSGGSGTFAPSNTTLNATYTPSEAELAADSIILTLTTNDPAGPCTASSSSVIFYFYKSPVVSFSVDESNGCPVHCSNFLNSTLVPGTSTVGDSIATWYWDFGDGGGGSSEQNPFNCFDQSGYYDIKLIATTNHGCISSLVQTHLVEVFTVPTAGFSTTPAHPDVLDPTVYFHNESSTDVTYWNWSFGDGDSILPNNSGPSHIYADSGTYTATLIVHNAYGCTDTVQHTIVIGPGFTFFIPNTFSPNGDGTNDFFFGKGIGIDKYQLLIFDRWGNLIFQTKNLSDGWDGKANNGSDASQIDVYAWKVEITDVLDKNHTFIGTVSIVR